VVTHRAVLAWRLSCDLGREPPKQSPISPSHVVHTFGTSVEAQVLACAR
jgi:hypothetical protein